MARIFITGSSDGLGSEMAKQLVAKGHKVVLHGRNAQRAADATRLCPGAETALVGDLTSIDETKKLAAAANALPGGPFDVVVHNAGLFLGQEKVIGPSGLPNLFTVNVLAPYILTALLDRPAAGSNGKQTLVYVSSQMHRGCKPNLGPDLVHSIYGDSKLQIVLLTKAIARRWADRGIVANAVDPGWVATKMGGASAPDKLQDAIDTFVMAALSEGAAAGQTGQYFRLSKELAAEPITDDVSVQDQLLAQLEKLSGVKLE